MPITSKNQELITYNSNDGQISFNVNVFEETVWLTQKQMAELFDTTIQNIGQNIKSVFESEELYENRTIKNFFIVRKEGSRLVQRDIEHYNLDMILSVGYRVQSKRATNFRIWARGILRQYLIGGYAINEKRIKALEDKIDNLSADLRQELKLEIRQINKSLFSNC